jgi:hypothetical protein
MTMHTRFAAAILVALAVSSSPSTSMAMDIVRDGRAVAVIVADKTGRELGQADVRKEQKRTARGFGCDDLAAANVLAEWIEKITDVRLEVVNQAPASGPAIYVGSAAIKAGLNLTGINSPTKEGLRIVSDGQTKILIAGQNDTATMKAVCRFLEELGCRYFMDNALGEVYPRSKTVTVGQLNIAEKPGLMLRKIWGSGWSGQSLWKVWNGAGGLSMDTGHAWGRYVDEKLFDTHPEYFALRDGQRRKGGWYCTSNPELCKIFAQSVISRGGYNPSVSPPDGTGYCQCEACRAQDDPDNIEPSSGRPSMTNRYVDFLDEVARDVAKAHPDWLLSFYCYADYTQPPTLGRKLSPNLVAWIAPIRYSRYHRIGSPSSASRRQLAQVIDGWAAAAEHIAYRTYNYSLAECSVPFSKLSVWKHDIPYLAKKGCIGINLESLANWEIYGPHLYQSIRLAYHPDTDSDALMHDFFMKFYGSNAGPFMKEYWLSIDKAFADMKCESGSFYALHLVYTPQFLQKLTGLVRSASDAARDSEKYSARVAMTAQGLENAAQYIQVRDAMNRGDFTEAKRIYDKLYARNEIEQDRGYGNHYTLNYLNRFLGGHVAAGASATAAPRRILRVLPDRMKLNYDPDDQGLAKGYHKPDFDDSNWRQVVTYSNTLNAQGLPDIKAIIWYRISIDIPPRQTRLGLFFTELDGQEVTVYVNGSEVASLGRQARRKPFEIDITEAAKPGQNTVAIKIDHRQITELFLGGIIRPILLIAEPTGEK